MNKRNVTRLAFAIVILSFVLSTFVSLWSLRLMAQRNVQELSKSIAARINNSISAELSEPVNVSMAMAHDSFLIEAMKGEDQAGKERTEERMKEYLGSLKEAFGYEAAFVISDASQYYYSYGGINKKMNPDEDVHDHWYREFVTSENAYELDVDHDELKEDRWTVFANARIVDEEGTLLGVCGVGARMTGNQDLFFTLEREYGVTISLIDESGLIQVCTDESRIQKESLKDVLISRNDEYVYQKESSGRLAVTKYIEDPDLYLVVESGGSVERRQLVNMLILNIVLCIGVLIIMLLAVRIIIARTRALTHASFMDQSTQLLNRRAFEERKAELSMSQLEEDFVYLTADLNGLKRVNDQLGHAAGDELIKGAAVCLKECFGRYGKIYRIGGDEFAAMLHLSEAQLEEAMKALDQASERWTGQYVKGLSLSCGYALSREFPSENIAELGRISDERMYEAKQAHYRKTGNQR